jgi:hypothetical protein
MTMHATPAEDIETESDNFEFAIHPTLAIILMMTDDELNNLAASIADNGLFDPIMLDHTGEVLIDGRCRFAACKLANIERKFKRLPVDEDLDAYILDVNLTRQYRSPSQHAMHTAMLFPEPKQGGSSLGADGVIARRENEARFVLRYSRPLAELVVRGAKALAEAVAIAQQQQQRRASREAKLTRLRLDAPDLTERVSNETLDLDVAFAEHEARDEELRDVRKRGDKAVDTIVPKFTASVTAIANAVDHGHQVGMTGEALAALAASYALLLEKVTKE